ncbi:substrate-binding domain-containing protein [Clostridium sp. C105KSO13]|uniref:substrate-binding domain-containing protein n=1 Tax=Clostridium sp. C105KSO13 TaxID=1776045 RepID=UPI0007406589|nr:substrate-binding domain-containing protein [Clostridium sp. C105KSO13]CUX36405.1 TMAO reductase system periplasmic protein TorT [Clostridium sp. C105KSO13]
MTHKRKIIILVLGICAAASVLAFLILPHRRGTEEVYQISYIHRGETTEDTQQVIFQGMEQAATEFNVEITTVSSGHPADAGEQKELLKTEVENGADAILIESVNNEVVRKEIEKISSEIPVVEVNSWTQKEDTGKRNKVHADDYEMGQKLGEKILEQSNLSEGVILIKCGTEYTDVAQRYKGTKDVLEAAVVPIEEVNVGTDEATRSAAFVDLLRDSKNRHIVAFSSTVLEQLGKVKQEEEDFKRIPICGIGNTNQIINYLENGIIQIIGVSNEYSIGYLSVRNAVEKLHGEEPQDNKIRYSIIDSGQMYSMENQRLLFPFVQ